MTKFEVPSCPRCGAIPDQKIERRPDGDAECGRCGFRGKAANWEVMVLPEEEGEDQSGLH